MYGTKIIPLYQSCKLWSFHSYQIYHTFGLFWVTQIDVDRCTIIYSYTYNTAYIELFLRPKKLTGFFLAQFVMSIKKYTCVLFILVPAWGQSPCSLGLWKSPTTVFRESLSYVWKMLTSALRVLVNNPYKKSFYGKWKKK